MESLAGCLGRDSIYIKLITDEIPVDSIFIPNAFTPNDDGLNDIFKAIATSDYLTEFNMLIFDRWGGKIFETNDLYYGWDGTKYGKPCTGDAYYYKITYKVYPALRDNAERIKYGIVILVR